MSKIDDLKYAIFYEWSEDPPCGSVSLYLDGWGTDYDFILRLANEVYSDTACQVYDDELVELKSAFKKVKKEPATAKSFDWENGGVGCGCMLLVEGKEIAKAAADFYYDHCANNVDDDEEDDWDEDENSDEDQKKESPIEKALQEAVANSEDYEKVICFLELLSRAIRKRNSRMQG